MGLVHQIFYTCLKLRFPDVETNPGPRRPVPSACRILRSNVRGLFRNLGDLTMASSQFDVLLCSETLVSDMRHVSELLRFPDLVAQSCCAGAVCLEPVGWLHTCEMDMELFANANLSVDIVK